MFTNQTGIVEQSGLKYPQIFMRGKESVHIPFKLQTFLAKIPPSENRTASNPFAQEQTYSVVEKNYNEKFKSKHIKVRDEDSPVDRGGDILGLAGDVPSRRRHANRYSIHPRRVSIADCRSNHSLHQWREHIAEARVPRTESPPSDDHRLTLPDCLRSPSFALYNSESLSTGLPEEVHQVFVRASDVNIVCEVKPVPVNQPCDMLIKV